MAREKKHIARREVRLLSVQDADVTRAITHLQENGYPALEFSEFARSVLWEFAKEILGESHRRPFVDAKVKRKPRKYAEPETSKPSICEGTIIPLNRDKPSDSE